MGGTTTAAAVTNGQTTASRWKETAGAVIVALGGLAIYAGIVAAGWHNRPHIVIPKLPASSTCGIGFPTLVYDVGYDAATIYQGHLYSRDGGNQDQGLLDDARSLRAYTGVDLRPLADMLDTYRVQFDYNRPALLNTVVPKGTDFPKAVGNYFAAENKAITACGMNAKQFPQANVVSSGYLS